ncbi:hypothetical protein QCA50_003739 [Cerrena zonata]|uniref:Uncharacterized protein n=1 Tax=Cerrena zonata TaxID=2478898 RepID=A0AAW0GM02_9APHY
MGSKSKSHTNADAARISNAIDEELKQERELRRRRGQKEIKVMLLGQAESGKSTLQKQFQLYYSAQSLDRERPSWRPIVYFNILKALRMILDELDFQYPQAVQPPSPTGSPPYSPIPPSTASSAGNVFSFTPPPSKLPSQSSSFSGHSSMPTPESSWFPELAYLRNKVLPLVASEEALASELSGGITVTGGRKGVYVRSGWQALVTPNRAWPLTEILATSARQTAVTNIVAKTLGANQNEIFRLWQHPAVQSLVRTNKLRLEESASFFLDEIHRISEPDYTPSTDDVLHVRLQTLGVTEHSFDIMMGGRQFNWLLYDVGGAVRVLSKPLSRALAHHQNIPREDRQVDTLRDDDFHTVNTSPSGMPTAIIFLAPISAYDQYLEEDPRTNRIDDSLQLFSTIVSNKLMVKAALVLMLNKTDLLRQKLAAGIKVRKYISSYGDRPNTYDEVSEYFRAHFIQTQKRKDPTRRSLYVHFTSMLDVKATQAIIVNVGEAIMRSHLSSIGLA